MNCKTCGAPLDEGALFCRKCGTEVPKTQPHPSSKRSPLSALKHNRTLLLWIAGAVLLLAAVLIVTVSVLSCSRRTPTTPEEIADAVVAALQKGDGDRLCALAKTGEAFLGQHTEQFGEGDSPEAVMRAYYRTLADDFKQHLTDAYGKDFLTEAQLTITYASGTAVFEPNRALNIEATQYATLTGPLTVSGSTIGTLRLVTAEINGEWKLLVVYLDF